MSLPGRPSSLTRPTPTPTRLADLTRPTFTRPTLTALGGYAATRLIGLAVLAIAAAATGKDGLHRLKGRWDSVWYVRVAEHGYGYEVTLPNGDVHSDLAFFPLLPALERGLSAVLPVDAATAGLLVSWTAALAAAWGIYRCGAHVAGERAGVLLAVLWGVYPTAFVQSMAYTETLFTALAAWSLYAVLRGRWILAGALCAAAGLTRPTAAALIAALGITALVTLVRERRLPLRTVAGVLLAPWAGSRTSPTSGSARRAPPPTSTSRPPGATPSTAASPSPGSSWVCPGPPPSGCAPRSHSSAGSSPSAYGRGSRCPCSSTRSASSSSPWSAPPTSAPGPA